MASPHKLGHLLAASPLPRPYSWMQWDLDPWVNQPGHEGWALVYSIYELKVLGTSDHCSTKPRKIPVDGKCHDSWSQIQLARPLHPASTPHGGLWPHQLHPAGPTPVKACCEVGWCTTWIISQPIGLRPSERWTTVRWRNLPTTAMTLSLMFLLCGVKELDCHSSFHD